MSLKQKFIIIALIGITSFPYSVRSQEEKSVRAAVFTTSGISMSGYLTEIRVGRDDDTLVLNSSKRTEKILVGDLARVIVLPRGHRESFFLAGALAGTYFWTFLLGHPENQSAGFITETYSSGYGLLLSAFLGVGLGGGLGGLFKTGSDNELLLDFNRNNGEEKIARKKLYEAFSSESNFPKLHLSIQGGHVYAVVNDEFQNVNSGNVYEDNYGNASNFNLLRKVQLTYSYTSDKEFGGAVIWNSEPYVSRYGWNYVQSTGYSSSHYYYQTLDVMGYYIIGKYKPFITELPHTIDFSLGGGIGVATIEYNRTINISDNNYNYLNNPTKISSSSNVNASTISATLFAECSYYLREYLSLGVVVDYVYNSPKKIPVDPVLLIPEQTLSGNSCIGFVVGFHL